MQICDILLMSNLILVHCPSMCVLHLSYLLFIENVHAVHPSKLATPQSKGRSALQDRSNTTHRPQATKNVPITFKRPSLSLKIPPTGTF